MKKYLLFLPFFVIFNSCGDFKTGHPNLEYSHYDVELKIIPENQFIKVSGSLKFLVPEDSLQELSFSLHRNLKIENFSVNGDNSFQLDTSKSNVRWIPDAMKIIYPASKKFDKDEIVDVNFSYEGIISGWPAWSANVITPDWIEMGLYFPWYPSIFGSFTYKVYVEINSEYNVFAVGESSDADNKKVFETGFPVTDFIICASKELTIRETELLGKPFQIVNSTLSNSTVDSIQADIETMYKLYSSRFGKIDVNRMSLVISKREKGGGYSRKGALFLGGMNDSDYFTQRIDNNRYIGHEISHFWWNGAESNWEDWLNESFAEYSAMILIRELYGEEEFNSRMETKRKQSIDTPPVWEISRSDPSAGKVLYSKGVVLLNELEEKIEKDKFIELCRTRIKNRINNTSGFLKLLNEISGKETAVWFEKSLKTR